MTDSLFQQAADVVQERTLAVANVDHSATADALFTHGIEKDAIQAIRELMSGYVDLDEMNVAAPAYLGLGTLLFRAAMMTGPDTIALSLAQAFTHGLVFARMQADAS